MPNTTVSVHDIANSGDPGHVEDHNVIRSAVIELQQISNTQLVDTDIVAGTNVTVTQGAGNSVTIAAGSAAHTHSTYEAADLDLQGQIDAIEASNAVPITVSRVAPGTLIVVDYAKNGNSWGSRPTSSTAVTVMWKGSVDPGLADPPVVLPHDIWFQTP